MTNQIRAIFILGIFVAILPFLGFPEIWKKIIFVLVGLGLITLAYSLREKKKDEGQKMESNS